jgi:hypothetical protein
MELNDLIPDNNKSWVVKKNFLFFYKYNNIPVCYIEDYVVFVFLDKKVKNPILRLLRKLIIEKKEFYLVTPELSDPKGVEDFNYENLYTYMLALVDNDWMEVFNRVNFDPVDSIISYINKYNCYDLIKPIWEKINEKINKMYYDYYSNSKIYSHKCDDFIRNEFTSVYRQIQLGVILS